MKIIHILKCSVRHILCMQLATTTLAMRECTVELMGESLRLIFSLAWSIIRGCGTWSQTSFRSEVLSFAHISLICSSRYLNYYLKCMDSLLFGYYIT